MSDDTPSREEVAEELGEIYIEVLEELPASSPDLAAALDIAESTARRRISKIRDHLDDEAVVHDGEQYRVNSDLPPFEPDDEEDELENEELTDRESYILRSLPATAQEIADDIGVSLEVAEAHLDTIARKGYDIEYKEASGTYYAADKGALASSDAMQTTTRSAKKWIQMGLDERDVEARELERPSYPANPTLGGQDIVSHITDLHMGDLIEDDDGEVVYDTEITQDVVRYITRKQLELLDLHSDRIEIDTFHDLWGGDFLTNEGIYKNQYEDLDAFLDEQHDALVEPLVERIKAISQHPAVDRLNIVCKDGNHGEHRASGKSGNANADLVLYKHIKNTIAAVRKHGDTDLFQNVNFQIGSHAEYKNFELRGGKLKGHLRHGQNRKAGFRTSAAQKEWSQTLLNHEFDLAYMGHVHRGQRFNVNGRPVFVTGTPKPSGDFAEQIAAGNDDNIALLHGVSDDGLTFSYPVDYRDFSREQQKAFVASYSPSKAGEQEVVTDGGQAFNDDGWMIPDDEVLE